MLPVGHHPSMVVLDLGLQLTIHCSEHCRVVLVVVRKRYKERREHGKRI